MEWFESKLISVFRQICHVECKDIGFSSPIPKSCEARTSALNIHCPHNVLNPGFSEINCTPIDSDFFSTETKIKTSGALSQGLCGCWKELKLRKYLELFQRKDFDSHSE